MEAPISEFMKLVLDDEKARKHLYKQLMSNGKKPQQSSIDCVLPVVSKRYTLQYKLKDDIQSEITHNSCAWIEIEALIDQCEEHNITDWQIHLE